MASVSPPNRAQQGDEGGPDASDVHAVAARGEGRRTEFKRGLQHDEKIARTIAAFANTRGGVILFGVGDRGEILGAAHPRRVAEDLRRIATSEVQPGASVRADLVDVRGSTIVWCSVPLSARRPHVVVDERGAREIVVRRGSSNRAATAPDLARLSAPRARHGDLDDVERDVLAWMSAEPRARAETIRSFARATGRGVQRARRAFGALEEAGFLVAHVGADEDRYFLPDPAGA